MPETVVNESSPTVSPNEKIEQKEAVKEVVTPPPVPVKQAEQRKPARSVDFEEQLRRQAVLLQQESEQPDDQLFKEGKPLPKLTNEATPTKKSARAKKLATERLAVELAQKRTLNEEVAIPKEQTVTEVEHSTEHPENDIDISNSETGHSETACLPLVSNEEYDYDKTVDDTVDEAVAEALDNNLLTLGREELGIAEEPAETEVEDLEVVHADYSEPETITEVPESRDWAPELEVAALVGELEQKKMEDMEPIEASKVEQLLNEAVTILAEIRLPEAAEVPRDETIDAERADTELAESDTQLDSEALIEDDTAEQKLTVITLEIFQTLGVEADEEQIKKVVQLLITHQETFAQFKQQPEPNDRGTHEILSHIASILGDIKDRILEPLHTLLGRMVLSSAQRQQGATALA